jgi:hypothetical protein
MIVWINLTRDKVNSIIKSLQTTRGDVLKWEMYSPTL